MGNNKLSISFYRQDDVVAIAKSLLGKILVTKIDGAYTAGRITETEAYRGRDDRACHAFGNKKTKRNASMFEEGGVSYVYLCYGIHNLFNVVVNKEGEGDAVLIRSLEPISGMEHMMSRRGMKKVEKRLCAGPGALAQAMGIGRKHDCVSLLSDEIYIIEDGDYVIKDSNIVKTTRVGVDYAGDDANKPWRFYIKDNPWFSKI